MIRNFINGAPLLLLADEVDESAVTLAVSSTAGYPNPPFTLTLERGTVNEEVTLCTAKGGTTFTVTRGWDGTIAKEHGVGAAIEHTTSAVDYVEANSHVHSSGDPHTQYLLRSAWSSKGTIMAATGAATPSPLSVGSNGQVLLANSSTSTGLQWGQVGTAGVADNSITHAKLAPAVQTATVQRLATGSLPGSPTIGQMVYNTTTNRWTGWRSSAWTTFATGVGTVTYSTSAPSGGADGDVHLRYSV